MPRKLIERYNVGIILLKYEYYPKARVQLMCQFLATSKKCCTVQAGGNVAGNYVVFVCYTRCFGQKVINRIESSELVRCVIIQQKVRGGIDSQKTNNKSKGERKMADGLAVFGYWTHLFLRLFCKLSKTKTRKLF